MCTLVGKTITSPVLTYNLAHGHFGGMQVACLLWQRVCSEKFPSRTSLSGGFGKEAFLCVPLLLGSKRAVSPKCGHEPILCVKSGEVMVFPTKVCRSEPISVLAVAMWQTVMPMPQRIFSSLQGQGMVFRSQRTPMGAAFPEKPLRLRMGSCHIWNILCLVPLGKCSQLD